jgi:hypothetical protein
MSFRKLIMLVCLGVIAVAAAAQGQTAGGQAAGAGPDAITRDLSSADPQSMKRAVDRITLSVERGSVPFELWRTWLPILMNFHQYQHVADLSGLAVGYRPSLETVEPLLQFRVKALLSLKRPSEALQAAKSYFNVCPSKNLDVALDLVQQSLAQLSAANADLQLQFRAEQVAASRSAFQGTAPPGTSVLKSIKIDDSDLEAAIERWKNQSGFNNRARYANLLLMDDHADEAMAVFRDLYLTATDADQLATATDGIARSLRAEDGNAARADAWLLAMEAAGANSK